MKHVRVLFLLLLASAAWASDNQPPAESVNFGVQDFSQGMFSYPAASEIPDNAANYIQNFYTDIQTGLVERNGSIKKESTILGGGKAVSGLWDFIAPDGTEYLIAFSSATFYKETNGGTFSSFGFPQSVTTIPSATVNLGRIWFTDGTDKVWSFDGTTSTTIASAPIGNYISSWRNRIAIGNITASLHSEVAFSADGDGTNWTIGGGDSDPFTIQIGGANDSFDVNCIYGMYQDTFIIGRKYDLWGLNGFTQGDVQVRKLSSEVGCTDNASMRESDGDLIWQDWRGIERMNPSVGIQLISDPIRDITDVVVKNSISQRSNTQSGSSAWNAGTFDSTTYVDTVTSSGNITFTYPDGFSNFRDGTSGTKNVWGSMLQTDSQSCSEGTVNYNASGSVSANGTLNLLNNGAITHTCNSLPSSENLGVTAQTVSQLANFKPGTTYQFVINTMPTDSSNDNVVFFSLATNKLGSGDFPGTNSGEWYYRFRSTQTATAFIDNASDSGHDSSSSLFSGAQFSLPATFEFYISTGNFSVTINGTLNKSGTHSFPDIAPYVYFSNRCVSAGTVQIDNFDVAPQTFTFTSQAISVGSSIGSWNPVTISDSKTGTGTITYSFASTNTATTSGLTYSSIANNGTPSVSTNTYAAFKAAFKTAAPGDSALLSSFQTSWNEGTTPTPTAWTWDRRYWLSITTNTGTGNYLDTILVYQRNKTWTIFKGLNADSFARWRDGLYYGDSSGNGLVYQFDTGTNDDGNAITAIVKTKSYDLTVPYREKDLRKMYVGYLGSTGFTGSFSVNYDIDRSGNAYSLGSANLNDYGGMNEAKFPFPLNSNPTQGREIQYTITKSDTGNPLQIYDIRTMYTLKTPR